MHVDWYGQSAFLLSADSTRVMIDPFGDMSAAAARGLEFNYPPIENVSADLVLVTHEHGDHNAVDRVSGDPPVIRSTAGRFDSPVGQVVGIASEHDPAAGTERGPNTIFVFELDGVRIAHFGDFGQSALRSEQAEAIGNLDLLLLPVGAGPVIGAEAAAEIVDRLSPKWVVPMHYRTSRVNFLEPVDPFLDRMDRVEHVSQPRFDTAELPASDGPLTVALAAP
jgi:L-ascorbate metabolism protein UlaG (beta-lactamase superfamily)